MSEEELKQMDKEELLGVIKAQRYEIEELQEKNDILKETLEANIQHIALLTKVNKDLAKSNKNPILNKEERYKRHLENEIERLAIELDNLRISETTRKYRINKAIKYIEKWQLGVDINDKPVMLANENEGKELLEILKGSDNG